MIVRARGSMWLYNPPELHAMSVQQGPTMGSTELELTGMTPTPETTYTTKTCFSPCFIDFFFFYQTHNKHTTNIQQVSILLRIPA